MIASYIADTTSWGKKRNLDNLPSFLENFSGNLNELWTAPSETGAPHTIIVASAGIRAANIARQVNYEFLRLGYSQVTIDQSESSPKKKRK